MARIAVVGMSNNPGGVETYLLNFIQAMGQDNELFFINITPTQPLAYADRIVAMGAHIFDAVGPYSLRQYTGRTRRAIKILTVLQADTVYVNALTTNFVYWVRAANALKIRSVFHSHSDAVVYSSWVKHLVAKLIKPFNQQDLATTVQLAASIPAARYMFGTKQHAAIIYNAIDPSLWRYQNDVRVATRASLGLTKSARVVIVVARMHPQKNYPKILNVMAAVVKRDPTARLILVGDGDAKQQVERRIDQLGLREKTLVLGQRRDVSALMWASDLLLMPSIYEGLPFIVVEAQGAGLPVLASANVIPQIANVTGAVHFCELDQSDDQWAQQVLTLIDQPNDRFLMNTLIAQSPFAMSQYVQQIKRIFMFK